MNKSRSLRSWSTHVLMKKCSRTYRQIHQRTSPPGWSCRRTPCPRSCSCSISSRGPLREWNANRYQSLYLVYAANKFRGNEGVRTTDDGSLTSTLDGGVGGKDGLALESSDGHHLGGSDRSSGSAGRGDEVSGEHVADVVTLSDGLWVWV